jgi:NhaA family Na+:H+ antiporter
MPAGVTVDVEVLTEVFTNPISLGIVLGLLVGKPVGITLGSWLAVRYTRAQLAPGITWPDIAGVGALAGIGFTVSLLIAALAFDGDDATGELAKTAVLSGSVLAALLAVVVLGRRNRMYQRLRAEGYSTGTQPAVNDGPTGSDPDGH